MFQALPGEIVWLRFSKFLASHHKSDIYRTEFCSNTLQLMDGPPYVNTNTSMIGKNIIWHIHIFFVQCKQIFTIAVEMS